MDLNPGRPSITLYGEDAALLEPVLRHYERFNLAHDGMYGDVAPRVAAIRHLANTWITSALGSSEVPEHDLAIPLPETEVTTEQAAEVLDLSDRRVRQLLEVGRLKGRKAGGSWLIDVASIAALTEKGE